MIKNMKPLVVVLLAAALLVSSVTGPAGALPRKTRVRTFAGGLQFPVDMAWVPGSKKIFFTEKNSGKIRIIQRRKLLKRACVDLPVNSAGERGALGIALHPRYRRNHYLYVYYTLAAPLANRVTRFTVKRNRCIQPKAIVKGLSASSSGYHNGGQIEFAGGKLFVATGEAHSPSLAQSRASRLGKILRYNPNGSIPKGNPFSRPGDRSPVWSYGHRNPFGLAHRPGTRRLYETENGPECDDELNRIKKGRNYGWGSGYSCGTAGVGPRPKGPLFRWSPPVVPTDPWWYRGRLGALSGSLYVGDFGTGRLHRFLLNERGGRLRSHRVVYDSSAGILDVSKGPAGWLYFATPGAIYRIVRR